MSLVVRRLLASGLRLVAVAIIARHITPADFGLVAFAQVVLLFMTLGGDTGIATYVIQNRGEHWQRRAVEAFWLSAIFGALTLAVATVPIFALGVEPGANLPTLLPVLAAIFAFRQLSAVPEALLRRDLRYRPLFFCDTATDLISAIGSVAMALAGAGVWSLVVPLVALEPLRFTSLFRLSQFRIAQHFSCRGIKEIGRFAGYSTANQLLTFALNDLDTLVVGKYLGATALGLYNQSWQLANVMGRTIGGPVANIATASLSAVKGSPLRLRNGYNRILRLLAATSFPAVAFVFAAADPIIFIIYGSEWQSAAPLLRTFSVFAAVRIVTSPSGTVCNVVGRPELNTKYALAFLPFYVIAVTGGLPFGMFGVCVAVTSVRTAGAVLWLAVSTRVIGADGTDTLLPIARQALIAALLALAGWALLTHTALHTAPTFAQVAVAAALVFSVYTAALVRFEQPTVVELIESFETILPKPAGDALRRVTSTA